MESPSRQIEWSQDQWNQINQTVQEEVTKSSVAGSFLPCYGPLAKSAEVVRRQNLLEFDEAGTPLRVDDVETLTLCSLTVHVYLKQQQMAQERIEDALLAFRRGANILARAEDAITFRGLPRRNPSREELNDILVPKQCLVTSGQKIEGLFQEGLKLRPTGYRIPVAEPPFSESIVRIIVAAITALEQNGHLGPFACVLGDQAYVEAFTPERGSLVLPSDRITPMLGMPLQRSGILPPRCGVVVSLCGDPIDLVVATPPTVQFLNISDEAQYHFRVYERFTYRVKETEAICSFELADPSTKQK
ncbi:encapsulin [Armatimonas sp.]|uniref:encapsulin n=1 Tax=Armatimonas sp. TaxID=1872638 RepID=UPI00286C1540|nr:family 1 encapsulin nanocompartment shell protein [Armatimonas sp.]